MAICNKLINSRIREKIGNFFALKIRKRLIDIDEYAKKNDIRIKKLKYNTDEKTEFVAEIKNGVVFSSWGVVLSPDGFIIDEVLPYSQVININKNEIGGRSLSYIFRKNKKNKTRAFSLISIFNVCYGHWIHESLPKLFLLKDSGFMNEIDTIVLGSGCKSNFHKDSLSLLGLEGKNVIYISDEENISFSSLFFSSFPGVRTHYPAKWVYEKYISLAKQLNEKNKDALRYKKIYISRNKAKTRKTLNEDKLLDILKPLGYEMLYMEDYPLYQQIIFFYSAEKIISPHGSGFTNMVFCQPKTSILDIVPSIRYEDVYKDIANAMNIKYLEYIEDNSNNFVYRDNLKKSGSESDLIVDIEKIKPYIEKLEAK